MRLIDPHQSPAADALVIANDADVTALADSIGNAPAVVLQFPKWTDGRAYSQAVLLRGRLRYSGEIQARGDIVVDMLPLLRRCGFDAAQLRADQNLEAAERTIVSFPGHYQRDLAAAGA